MTITDDYVLGRSAEEYERLRGQARMWEPETTRLLDRVGPPLDGYCLDVGCGPGETMRLMAERVGPGGRVTGIDVDAAVGAQAIAALHAAGQRPSRSTLRTAASRPHAVPGTDAVKASLASPA